MIASWERRRPAGSFGDGEAERVDRRRARCEILEAAGGIVGESAVGIDGDRAPCARGVDADGEGVAGVGVEEERRAGERRSVFIDSGHHVEGIGRDIAALHGDGHGARDGAAVPVVDGDGVILCQRLAGLQIGQRAIVDGEAPGDRAGGAAGRVLGDGRGEVAAVAPPSGVTERICESLRSRSPKAMLPPALCVVLPKSGALSGRRVTEAAAGVVAQAAVVVDAHRAARAGEVDAGRVRVDRVGFAERRRQIDRRPVLRYPAAASPEARNQALARPAFTSSGFTLLK